MVPVSQLASAIDGRRVIATIGVLYIVFAAIWAYVRTTGGEPALNVVIVTTLIVGPGVVLLYGGYRLPQFDIHPEFQSVIGAWCLLTIGVMTAILSLYHFQPADSFRNPYRSFLMFTALSSVAGLGMGLYEARAKTRALEVDQRNRELQRMRELLEESNERLERSNERLERSNERLEQFAHAASHDLQEPLRMITRYLSLVEQRYADALDEDGREFVTYAADGADRLREMIDGLLEYSLVEVQGNSFEPVDLDVVLEEVLDSLHLCIEESGAEITTESLPIVDGDGRQLRQVFQNLLSNAITYSGRDPPRIRVEAERRDREWLVSVTDCGIGIDPGDQEQLFEVFHRLHSREEYAGTGIGLALCKRIVEHHGGRIWVKSVPGEGSTFSFTLPTTGQ